MTGDPGESLVAQAEAVQRLLSTQLKKHQLEGLIWLLGRNRGVVADQMGMGKTIQLISLLMSYCRAKPGGHHLILVPKSLIGHWFSEFRQHVRPEYMPRILQRPKKPEDISRSQIVLMNYERWRQICNKQPRFLEGVEWDSVVLDEAHRIRSNKSLLTRRVMSIPAARRWCVTGTPFNNTFHDVVTLCQFLKLADSSSAEWWRANWHNKPVVRDWCRQYMLRRLRSSLVDAPTPATEEVHRIRFSAEEQKTYNYVESMLQKHYVSMKQGTGEGSIQEQLSVILLFVLRLRQWCNHPRLILKDSTTPSSKTEALRALLGTMVIPEATTPEVTTLQKTVIFSMWTGYLNIVADMLREMRVRYTIYHGGINKTEHRDSIIREFQGEPTVSVLLSTTHAGGLGLNLSVASNVIVTDRWYNPFVDIQAIDRLNRIGQKQRVRIIRLEIENSIEQRVRAVQNHKYRQASKLMFNSHLGAVAAPLSSFDEEGDDEEGDVCQSVLLPDQNPLRLSLDDIDCLVHCPPPPPRGK